MIARRLMVTGLLAVGVSAPLFAGDRPESLSEWAQRQQTVGGDASRLPVDSSKVYVAQKPNPAPLTIAAPVAPAAKATAQPVSSANASPVAGASSTQTKVQVEDISAQTAPRSSDRASSSMFGSNTQATWNAAGIAPEQPADARVIVPSASTDDQTHAYASHVAVGVGIGVGVGVGIGVGVGFHSHEYRHHDVVYVGTGYYGGYYRPAYCGTVVYSEPAYYAAPVYYAPVAYQPVYYEPAYYSQPVVYYRPAYYYAPGPCYRAVGYYPQPAFGLSIGVRGRF